MAMVMHYPMLNHIKALATTQPQASNKKQAAVTRTTTVTAATAAKQVPRVHFMYFYIFIIATPNHRK
jgi:hypothetical protein